MVKYFGCIPTYVITIHQRFTDRQTDRQTCDSNTALCTKVHHRAVKTVELKIMTLSAYGSPIPLVFGGKFHPNSKGFPERGRQTRAGREK